MNNELNNKTEKKVRLDTARHVKRFMQSVINNYNNDVISDVKAKTLATLVNSYTKIIELVKIQDKTISWGFPSNNDNDNDNELDEFDT